MIALTIDILHEGQNTQAEVFLLVKPIAGSTVVALPMNVQSPGSSVDDLSGHGRVNVVDLIYESYSAARVKAPRLGKPTPADPRQTALRHRKAFAARDSRGGDSAVRRGVYLEDGAQTP